MVVPVFFVLFQFISLILPLNKKAIYKVLVSLEILKFWGALEVYIVSIIANLFQLKQFLQFMLGDKCTLINILLQSYSGLLIDGDYKCFDVQADLMLGTL